MEFRSKAVLIILLCVLIQACGGGDTSSGGDTPVVATPDPVVVPDPGPTVISGESALECIDNDKVEVRLNRTALMQNLCGFAVNVAQLNSRFPGPPPITEIPPGQIVAVALADDQTSISYGVCRAPSVPENAEEEGFFFCPDVIVQGKQLINSKSLNKLRSPRASYRSN